MNWYSILGVVASVVLFVPIILILALKLFTYRSFIALMLYYFVTGSYNLIAQNIITVPVWLSHPLGILNNLLDAPLMLIFLTLFSTSSAMTKRITFTLLIFIAFEIIILSIYGFNVKTVKIVLGPGIAIIGVISFLFFIRNTRLAITHPKSLGKAVMISSVLLAYSIFSLVYLFFYILKTKYKQDTELVYYLVSFLSAILMTTGIFIENKRIKKLNELKHTRRELAAIYSETKKAALKKDSLFLRTRGY